MSVSSVFSRSVLSQSVCSQSVCSQSVSSQLSLLTEAEFDACVQPLLRNLTYRAERLCGPADGPDRVTDTLLIAWKNLRDFTPPSNRQVHSVCFPASSSSSSSSSSSFSSSDSTPISARCSSSAVSSAVSASHSHLAPRVLPRAYGTRWDQRAFLGWLHQILAFECATYIRNQARHPATLLPAHAIFTLCDGPSAPSWEDDRWQEQRNELYRLLQKARLSPRQREFTLRWLQGETLRAIGRSAVPPISARAVCGQIQRAGKILRKLHDPDRITPADIRECFENLPAALTYQSQRQRWARERQE